MRCEKTGLLLVTLWHFCGIMAGSGRPAVQAGPAPTAAGRSAAQSAEELAAPLRDDFQGKPSLKWTVVRPDASHASLTRHPGKLTITTQGGDLLGDGARYAAATGLHARNVYLVDNPLPGGGDLVVTTHIESFRPKTPWQQAGLVIYDDDDNYLKWDFEVSQRAASRQALALVRETNSVRSPEITELPAPLDRVWLRIIKRGDRYQHAYSVDGREYTVLGEKAWGNGKPRWLGLVASNGRNAKAEALDACFDFFEVRALTPAEKGHASELLRLQGSWEAVSCRVGGQLVREPPLSRLAFAGSQLTVEETGQSLNAEYTLDVTKNPKQLLMTPRGAEVKRPSLRAVYALEGDQLILCFDTRADALPPAALETKEGDGRLLATFRRAPRPGAPAPPAAGAKR